MTSAKRKYTKPSWRDALDVDYCVDVFVPYKGWEFGVIEEVMKATNEVRIRLPDGKKNVAVSASMNCVEWTNVFFVLYRNS